MISLEVTITAVKRAFPVEWINPLAKAARHLAFHRPKIGGGVRLEPVSRSGIAGEAHGQTDHGGSGQGRSTQGVQLIERRAYIAIMNLIGRRGHQCGLSLQPIEGRNFPRDRTQRSDLHVALFGHLLQAGVVVFELIFFGPQLVITGNLQQHACVGTGDAGETQESDCGPHDEHVKVMHGDRDFAQLAVVPAGHKKDVKAFLQIAPQEPEYRF